MRLISPHWQKSDFFISLPSIVLSRKSMTNGFLNDNRSSEMAHPGTNRLPHQNLAIVRNLWSQMETADVTKKAS